MINKNFTIFITVVTTILCIYYLSFTLVSNNVNHDATEYARDESGNVNFNRKQAYLDSVWNEPVYNLVGIKYTYKEVKDIELGLGLDLQGGMHVTLEISPVDIIRALSGNSEDPVFNQALQMAQEKQRNSQENFTSLFYDSFKEINPDGSLNAIFANASNRGRISFNSTDEEIMSVIETEVSDAIDRSFQIISSRIDRFGTSAPNIQRLQGSSRIQVELPGVENRERVRKLLQGVAKLEFWEVLELQEYGNTLTAINAKLMEEQRRLAQQGKVTERTDNATMAAGKDTASVADEADDLAGLLDGGQTDTAASELAAQLAGDSTSVDSLQNALISPLFSLRKAPYYALFYDVKDTSKINRLLALPEVRVLIPNNIKFLWQNKPNVVPGQPEVLELYAVKIRRGGQAPLTGEVIIDARQDFDDMGRPAVSMQMDGNGAKVWRRLTAENINRRIAIVLDNYVYSAPNVINEIPNGNSQISGNFTVEETRDLSNILKTGKLPAPTRIVEEAVIGPTLGKKAQAQGIISVVSALAAVVVFMVAYYAKSGLIANVALTFNIFFILGILAQLNASLTLPGIAGIVLTMGMAVDANVLITERIREEMRGGASLMNAISNGYSKALSAIIDGNVTTFLIGAIMYLFGEGPVRGFATTLMIGIACSVFTAVFVSKVIMTWVTKKGENSKITFSTFWSKNILVGSNIDFMGKRKIAYIFSSLFIIGGFVVIFFQGGLNLGVDFTGGRSYVVLFDKKVFPSELKTALSSSFGGSGTEVKSYGSDNAVKVTTSYLINDESSIADSTVENTLIRGIASSTGLSYKPDNADLDVNSFTISGTSKVGATIADDIKNASLEAILISLVAIFIYIVIRFRKWQFGLGGVTALFHDALFVIAAIAYARLFGKAFEVDQVFIAAILTVIGYSINDTVVIFDRVREFSVLKPGTAIYPLINESLNTTLSRTILTAGTTLLVVLVLFIFGGEVLRGFSFSLLIGVSIGTYSSLFIAAPIVLDFAKDKTVLK